MSTSPTPLQADSGTSSKPDDNSLETFSAPSSSKPIAITSHDDGIVTSSFAGEVSQSGEVDVQVCRFFARRGWCKFKKSCRYLHERREPLPRTRRQQDAVIPGEIRDTASKAVDAVDLEAEDLSKSATTTLLEGPIKICKYFSKYGTCRYSARCKFRHEKDKPPRLPTDDDSSRELAETRDEDDQIEAAAKPVGVPVQKKDGRQRRRPRLCRYYKAGHCTMGNKCRFWHPKDVLDLDAPENGNFVDVARQETVTGTEQAGESVPAKKQPGRRVFSRPDKYKLEALADGELAKLRETEIEQIKKRYPNGQGEALGTRYGFQFILMPSDPDWPYAAKHVPLRFLFPEAYPKEMLTVSLPEDDVLPDTLRRHLRMSIKDWLQDKQRVLQDSNTVQLVVRPLLRWMDRTLEEMFTEGLKKYQLELVAQAAGLEFIPASRLQEKQESDLQDEQTDEQEAGENESGTTAEDADDDDKENQFDGNVETSEKSDKDSQTRSLTALDPAKRGTEVKLHQLQLGENVATLLATKIQLIIQCNRCKNQTEVTTPPDRLNLAPCNRCLEEQLVNYRASLVHQFNAVIGYLDIKGCTAFDLILSECEFQLGCLACSKDMIMQGLPPGQPKETWCRHCHQKMRLAAETTKFHQLQPAENVLDTSKGHNVQVKKLIRVIKDPAIQDGKALPNNGTCKHYKKSFRWLRFPCCGKTYPCDLCHDDHETDHEMKFANRMICGYCCREQAYAAEKPCVSCQSSLTKKVTAHWEGGKGCRDKVKMSRDDVKKYASTNKTISRKAQALQAPKKKATKA